MPEVLLSEMSKTYQLSDIDKVAGELVEAMNGFLVCQLIGEMGSGKTTLVKAIGRQLGVSEVIASPTFSIVNEYQTNNGATIYHFDFYRIKSETEAYDMGVYEYFDSGNLCLIEWPEKIPTLLPETIFTIKLTILDTETRSITYGKH
jgi:tRNA threonylcarbamoyladenosine biosynthesis protein TsaE